MHSRSIALLILALGLLIVAGCSDDTVEPEAFAVTVTVTDDEGEPVSGLRASLSPDVDGVMWPHGGKNDKPATQIAFDLPVPMDFTLAIQAVDGAAVWSVSDESMPEGMHSVAWTGVDAHGERVHDGYYLAVLTAVSADDPETTVTDEIPLLLVTGSPDDLTVATTDAAGRFTVADRTYVPAFWDLLPLEQLNEQGEVVGVLELTTATRLVLVDDVGNAMTHVFEAVDGPQTLELTWPH